MDIFAGVDIDSIRQKLDSGVDLDDETLKKSKPDALLDAKLSAKWLPSEGLEITIPQSLLDNMGWSENTKLDVILHDNVIILYPMSGFLNLRKVPYKTGKSVLIKKENFLDSGEMSELAENCKIWEDDVTCYYRLMLQFPKTLPTAFSY